MATLQPALFGQSAQGVNFNDLYKLQLAKSLMGGDASNIKAPTQGLAHVANSLLGALMFKQLGADQQERQAGAASTMQQAMNAAKPTWTNPDTMDVRPKDASGGVMAAPGGGQYMMPGETVKTGGGQDAMVRVLMSNPQTASIGVQMQMESLKQQQQLANEFAKAEQQKKLSLQYDPQIDAAKGNAMIAVKVAEINAMKIPEAEKARLIAEAQAPSQMKVGSANAYASANAGLSVAEKKAAAEARGKQSVQPPGFQGNELNVQMLNVVRTAEARMAAGQTMSPAEQYDYQLAKRHLEAPTVVGTPETGYTQVEKPPLPGYPGTAGAGQPTGRVQQITAPNKDIPETINKGITENVAAVRKIDAALAALKEDPSATGIKGYLPNALLNRVDQKGTEARALVADIGSLKLHDRSGAAITAAESPRLLPFIPQATDDINTVRTKLGLFRKEYEAMLNDTGSICSAKQGFKPNPVLQEFIKGQATPATRPRAQNGAGQMIEFDGKAWVPVQ